MMISQEMLQQYKEGKLSTSELREKIHDLTNSAAIRRPLSEGQKGLWMLEKMSPGMSAYNLPVCFRVRERLDAALLEQALHDMLEHYPILKTVIEEEDGVPCQSIRPTVSPFFRIEDISRLEREEIIPYIQNIARTPFALLQGPLLRVHLFEGSAEGPIVLMNVHHLIVDGVSIIILVKRLLDGYLALSKGSELSPPAPSSSFYDYIDWEKELLTSKQGEEHRAYWKQQLSGALPIVELPVETTHYSAASFNGEIYSVTIPIDQKGHIKAFSNLHRMSLPSFFLGLLKVVLYQFSNQKELIVGMASAGRPDERFESSVGNFINMLPIRSRIEEKQSVLTFFEELQLTMLDGMDHADYPFPAIVRELNLPRTLLTSPVFQVGYFYQNFMQAASMSELQHYQNILHIDLLDEIHQKGEYGLTLEVFEHEYGFRLNMKYNPDLYNNSMIRRMSDNMVRLAGEVVQNPELALNELPLLSAEQTRTVLRDWNATERTYPRSPCVHDLFSEQVTRTPEETAVIYENESLTYRELNDRSTKLAIYLQKQGVKPNTLVGISVERSLDMIVGLLGILKAGAAYVPLDPEYPTDRLAYMIQDSGVSIVLTQAALTAKVNRLLGPEAQAIALDTAWGTIVRTVKDSDRLERTATPDTLAYVIYTSGSTGNPKGVMIPHAALTNFLFSMGEEPGLTAEDKLLAVTTYSFDIAGLELYLPLIKGAQCYICSTEKQKNIEKLQQEIGRIKPTIMQATPAIWTTLFLLGWRNEERVKILCGGEALPDRLKRYFTETRSEVWNMFGPTETTIWSTLKLIKADEPITIGHPIANTQIYILNSNLLPVPIAVPGELYIGGDGLAKGYLNMPKLTAERFIDNPFLPRERIYRTGDSARWLPNGEIEFLGRIDNQVKMNGFRIELDEIETRLNMYPGIKENAVVIAEHNENKQMRAFYVRKVLHPGIDSKELRSYLKKTLPAHMVPSVLTEIDSIPLTPNGKVNRLELSKRSLIPPVKENDRYTASETESDVLEIWKEVIGVQEFSLDDGFFEVGGDSFTAVTVADRINRQLGCDLKVTDVFAYANIRDISRYIMEIKNGSIQTNEADKHKEDSDWKHSTADAGRISQTKSYPEYYEDSVAIIGISCQLPGANTYHEFWQNLRDGKESVKQLSKDELKQMGVPQEIMEHPNFVPIQLTIEGKDSFDPEFFKLSRKDAEFMDPQMRLLLLHSWKAIEDAGYVSKEIPNTAVYMSSSNNSYQAPEDSRKINVLENSDRYVTWLLGQGGTIPTMISYQLGLKGPSFAVHSNCSSSLVGLYSAYQSIQSGEAEYALVGGSTIHSETNAGYIHLPGLNLSSNGHVSAFDASADGMIGGEGVAVVVLKNAAKAIEDGDHVYSLLRGIKINNDGSEKVGFYAPSIKGQADVIRNVLESTKIDPETVSYVEAHGTGTKLGDPIELSALNQVYTKYTMKKQYCGIGSVKSNIGHLDTASGLAGCIKVALSLYNNQIPPTLNFKEANPEIDFDHSPFYVVEQLTDLEDKPFPHRAALSSFGIGGTNVHAIFEKVKVASAGMDLPEAHKRDYYLLPLSAKNVDRLKAYSIELLDFLNYSHYPNDLDRIAYTLQIGREAMEHRVVFLVRDIGDLSQKLEAYIEGKAKIDNCFEDKVQHSREGLDLFEKDEDTNELIQKWMAKGKWHKIAKLWVRGVQMDWGMLYDPSDKPHRVSLPTYPFANEKFWKATKERKLEDATEQMVSLKVMDMLHPLIARNSSDFTEQKYTTLLSGEEFYLVDHVINAKKVLPGVIYVEMGRAAGELAAKQKVKKIKNIIWTRPIIVDTLREMDIVLLPHESEVEYKAITVENGERIVHAQGRLEYTNDPSGRNVIPNGHESFDIEGCISRCAGYISHADFYESDTASVYQYGTTFRPIRDMYVSDTEVISRLNLPSERDRDFNKYTLHPSLLEGCLQTVVGLMKTRDVTPFMPFSIDEIEILNAFPKQCYVYATWADPGTAKGDAVKFNMKLLNAQGQLLAVIKNYSIRTITPAFEAAPPTEALETVYYHSTWERKELGTPAADSLDTVLIFDDRTNGQDVFMAGTRSIVVKPGGYQANADNLYTIQPGEPDDYRKLMAELREKNFMPNKIVHRWSQHSAQDINGQLEMGIYSLFYLTQSLKEYFPNENVKVLTVYNDESDVSSALCEAISGFAKTVRLEHPKYGMKVIQLQSTSKSLNEIVLAEFGADDGEEVRYTDDGRYTKQLQEDHMKSEMPATPVPFRNEGVYLITGGMGGLGLVVARYLADTLKAKLVLVGRSPLDENKKASIAKLEALGSEVLYVQADVTMREDAVQAISEAHKRFQGLHGIIHAAGVIQDKLILNKTYPEMRDVLAPKVKGTLWLDEASRAEPLDFFILFSSVSHLGNAGQSDYAYANSFLNCFAAYRENQRTMNKRAGKTVSINWPIWEEGGMQMGEGALQFLKKVKGIHPLPNIAGLQVIEKALSQRHHDVTVYYGDPVKIRLGIIPNKIEAQPKVVTDPNPPIVQVEQDVKAIVEQVTEFLVKTASALLRIPKMDIDRDMEQYGFDSISNTEFTNKINDYYQLDIMPTIFFELEQPTIRSLAQNLSEKYAERLHSVYQKLRSARIEPLKSDHGLSANRSLLSHAAEEGMIVNPDDKRGRFRSTDLPAQSAIVVHRDNRDEEPIAIIGMSGIFPQSDDLNEFWHNLVAGKNMVTEIPSDRFDWRVFNDPKLKWGGFMKEVDTFDAAFFGISEREAEVMDPQHRLFLQNAWNTIEDAGYKPSDLSGSDTGIFVGIGTQDYSQLIDQHMVDHNPYALTGRTPFMLVNRISSILNLHGPSEPVDTACSSSLIAIHKAAEAIRSGSCQMAIAGGVNVILMPSVHLYFSAAGMLSETGQCSVFDKDANGTIRSEGVGAVLLKRKSDAIADGDHIYALIRSSAENHKGKSASLTAPNANAQADLLIDVYQKAGVDPTTISCIETHSTGTKIGDPIEITGLKNAFSALYSKHGISEVQPHCALSSLKTHTGHLEAAAGIGAFIKVLLSLQHEILPGTLHYKELNPYINLDNSPFYINDKTRPWNRIAEDIPRRAGVSAFGFGGVNAHVMIEEYIPVEKEETPILVNAENPAIIVLSANSEERLVVQAKQLLDAVEQHQYNDADLAHIAYTLQVGREALNERLALTAGSINELRAKLLGFIQSNKDFGSDCHRGVVNKSDDIVAWLAKDEGMHDLIASWMEQGAYDKLLSLWVRGLVMDWSKLYPHKKPRRMPLPTYPFEKKRYWVVKHNQNLSQASLEVSDLSRDFICSGEREVSTVQNTVLNLLSRLLGMEASEIDTDRPVAEMGVDSIILTQLLQQLQAMDPFIDFESLYLCRTVRDMINIFSKHKDQKKQYMMEGPGSESEAFVAEYPELIRLNRAFQKRPVFWFHGGFGGVEVYRLIAQKIDRPFYGIQARGYMTDDEPIQGIEAMASYYVRMIQSVQPEGPYDFGGLSLGGMIAYEVARQMQEQGQAVNSILMLESIYVDDTMRKEWQTIPTLNLKKDRMLRAVNLLLAFSSTEELTLIPESEMNINFSDEAFLEQLIELAAQKGSTKSAAQLRRSVVQLEKILNALDMSTTFYEALPLTDPDSVHCYYFCNPEGTLFGEDESYFRLVDKGRVYDYLEFVRRWKEKLPVLTILKVDASNHLTLLTEPQSQEVISSFCTQLYGNEKIGEYV